MGRQPQESVLPPLLKVTVPLKGIFTTVGLYLELEDFLTSWFVKTFLTESLLGFACFLSPLLLKYPVSVARLQGPLPSSLQSMSSQASSQTP